MIKYTWQEFQQDCETLYSHIKVENFDAIVGITRGGMMLATMLSEISGNKKLYALGYNSYVGEKKNDELVKTTNMHPDLKRKSILLCDDISDSGDTLLQAKKDLEAKKNEVFIVTLHFKNKTKVMPDICLNEAERWIDYPWDYKN